MRQLVIDIETSAVPFDTLSESQQEYILRDSEKETDPELRAKKAEDAIKWLSLYPFTAKAIVIGIYDVQSHKRYMYYESAEEKEEILDDKNMVLKGMPEEKILEKFWQIVAQVDQVITFNGRGFDIPFLMLRSAQLNIKPSRNFLGYRYDTGNHIDLLEQLSFYGGFKRFNLDFYCYSFGIKSPKSEGVSGVEVQNMYLAGRLREIALYCGNDIKATYELYVKWNENLNFKDQKR